MGMAGEAPKRGGAEAPALAVEERSPKRARAALANVEEQLATVVAALDGAEQLSATGKELLRSMAGGCLRTAPELRHELQVSVAGMLRQALEGVAEGLRGKAAGAAEALREAEARTTALSEAWQSSKAALEQRARGIEEARRAFTEANLALEAAWARADEARRTRDEQDGKWLGTGDLRRDLERTLEQHFKPLLAGTGDLQVHAAAVDAIVGRVAVEDSLKKAFRAAAKVKPADRGAFDRSAMEKMMQELQKRGAELEATAQAPPEGFPERQAAVEAAEAAWQEARAQMRAAAAALRAAELAEWRAEGAADFAEDAVLGAEAAVAAAAERRASEEAALAAFKAGPLTAYEALEGAPRPGEAPAAPLLPVASGPSDKESVATPKRGAEGHQPAADSMAGVPTPMRAAA